MTVWIIRAGREGERVELCLDAGVSAIGWDRLGDLSGLGRSEIRALIDKAVPDTSANTRAAWAEGLDRFVSKVAVGDFVIMPYKGAPKIAIGRITSPYRHRLDLGDGNTHTRDVSWLEPEYDRSLLPDDITKALAGAVPTIQRIKSSLAEPEVRQLLGLDEAHQAVHLLLRWSADEPRTLEQHRDVAQQQGSVWWGKIGDPSGRKPLSARNLGRFQQQVEEGTPTHVYLYRSGEAWRTDLLGITLDENDVTASLIPGYYGSEPHNLWVHLSNFERLAPEWPLDNLVLSSDPTKTVREAAGGQASLFIVQERIKQARDAITWWVNQGQTYLQERDGGYMWAPKQSKGAGVGPRPYWTTMTEVRPGDRIVHYRNSAIRAVSRAVSASEDAMRPGELPSEAWEQEGWLVRTNYQELADPLRLDTIATEWLVPASGPFNATGRVHQGYLFRLSLEFGEELARMLSEREFVTGEERPSETQVDGSLAELTRRTHFEPAELEELLELMQSRRQVIFHGPPGSGKTWVAEALARHLTDNALDSDETNDRLELVQFHQSYGYEDFMQGIRPVTTEGGRLEYHVQPGVLMRFIKQETWDSEKVYVLVIDEINRGNISRIFGELLLLLEYRDKQVRLPYADPDESKFRLPANLLIVGTMNTADRSLASIDYALRRRFAFHRLSPVERGEATVLKRWLGRQPTVPSSTRAEVLRLFLELNRRVEDEMGAGGEDFQIGHSYFMTQQVFTEAGRARIWRTSIRPLLEEYFANRKERSQLLDRFEPAALLRTDRPSEQAEAEIEEDQE